MAIKTDQSLYPRDDHNRSSYDDLFSLEFTHPISNPSTQLELGLPAKVWSELSADEIKGVVEYWKSRLPHERIGKMHNLMPRSLDYRYVFNGFTVIDIRASTTNAWIIRAFHLFKSAFRKKTDDYLRYARMFGPNEEEKFAAHVNAHGWWPEWYAWGGAVPVEEFIRVEMEVHHRYAMSSPPILDFWIDSIDFILDDAMPWLSDFKKKIGVDLDNDVTRQYLLPWIKKNNEILDFMGLRSHINKDYDRMKQREILHNMFIEKHMDILRFNG